MSWSPALRTHTAFLLLTRRGKVALARSQVTLCGGEVRPVRLGLTPSAARQGHTGTQVSQA